MPLNDLQAEMLRTMHRDTMQYLDEKQQVTDEQMDEFIRVYGTPEQADHAATVSKVVTSIKEMMYIDDDVAFALRDVLRDIHHIMTTEHAQLNELATMTGQEMTTRHIKSKDQKAARTKLEAISTKRATLQREKLKKIAPSTILADHQTRLTAQRAEEAADKQADTQEIFDLLSATAQASPEATLLLATNDVEGMYLLYCRDQGYTAGDLLSEIPVTAGETFGLKPADETKYKDVLTARLIAGSPVQRILLHHAQAYMGKYTSTSDGAQYSSDTRAVNLHADKELTDIRGCGGTYYHEMGHMVDDNIARARYDGFTEQEVSAIEQNIADATMDARLAMLQTNIDRRRNMLASQTQPEIIAMYQDQLNKNLEKQRQSVALKGEWQRVDSHTMSRKAYGALLRDIGTRYSELSLLSVAHVTSTVTDKEPDLTMYTTRMRQAYDRYLENFVRPVYESTDEKSPEIKQKLEKAIYERLYNDIVVRAQYDQDHGLDMTAHGGSVQAAAMRMSKMYRELLDKSPAKQREFLQESDPLVRHRGFRAVNRYQHMSGISDIFGSYAMMDNTAEGDRLDDRLIYGHHDKSYWKGDKQRASEAWAEMSECIMGGSKEQVLFYREYMPEAYRYFIDMNRRQLRRVKQ